MKYIENKNIIKRIEDSDYVIKMYMKQSEKILYTEFRKTPRINKDDLFQENLLKAITKSKNSIIQRYLQFKITEKTNVFSYWQTSILNNYYVELKKIYEYEHFKKEYEKINLCGYYFDDYDFDVPDDKTEKYKKTEEKSWFEEDAKRLGIL